MYHVFIVVHSSIDTIRSTLNNIRQIWQGETVYYYFKTINGYTKERFSLLHMVDKLSRLNGYFRSTTELLIVLKTKYIGSILSRVEKHNRNLIAPSQDCFLGDIHFVIMYAIDLMC